MKYNDISWIVCKKNSPITLFEFSPERIVLPKNYQIIELKPYGFNKEYYLKSKHPKNDLIRLIRSGLKANNA